MTGVVAGVVRVLVVGPRYPSHNSRGGMATIVGLMREQRDPRVQLTTVATYVDDMWAVRGMVALWGLLASSVLILSGQVDVVHVHLAHRGSVVRKSLPLLVARLRGVPAVIHAHSYDFAGWFDTLSRWKQRLVRAMLPARRWLVLGEVLVPAYRERFDLTPDQIQVLYNPAPPVRPGSTGLTDQATGRVLAVGLGRMGQRKGTYDLLDALDRLSRTTRACLRVVLAGDGDVDGVRSEIARRGLGEVVEARTWLSSTKRDDLLDHAEVFLLPSHAEGLPMAMLEAMSAGLVPVVSGVGAIEEIARDDRNALLVAPGDPIALAAAIECLVLDDDRRHRLSAGARQVAEGMSVQAWFDDLVEVWTCVLKESVETGAAQPH